MIGRAVKADRKEHAPEASAQTPFPGLTSNVSLVVLTTNVAPFMLTIINKNAKTIKKTPLKISEKISIDIGIAL